MTALERIDYTEGGTALTGWLARPAGSPRAAIVVFPTIANFNAPAERRATMLAEAGSSGRPETEVELEHFGFTHADVGSVLAIKWFLPEDLTVAIRYHHAPAKDPFHPELSSLIHLADHLAWTAGLPSTRGVPPRNEMFDSVPTQIGIRSPSVTSGVRMMCGVRVSMTSVRL